MCGNILGISTDQSKPKDVLVYDRINCHKQLYLVSLFKLVLSDSSGYVYL